mmetsp:Transcript_5298/g.18455  ORF Transcript_5298/g.18455 Transcript_5298/m.18455 type:complete len:122 (-) Transcript_5298:136-501(-)
MEASNPKVRCAIIGAGITGVCNPTHDNYHVYRSASAQGSLTAVLTGVGHVDFLEKGIFRSAAQRVCGGGEGSRAAERAADLAGVLLTWWLEAELRHASLAPLLEWLECEQSAKELEFDIKT